MTTFRPVSFWLHVSSPGAPGIVSDAIACASKRPDFSVLTVSTAPLPDQSRTVACRIVPALSRVKRMSCAVPVGKCFVKSVGPSPKTSHALVAKIASPMTPVHCPSSSVAGPGYS